MNAAAQENFNKVVFAISQRGMGPLLYRMAPLISSESAIEKDSRTSDEHDDLVG